MEVVVCSFLVDVKRTPQCIVRQNVRDSGSLWEVDGHWEGCVVFAQWQWLLRLRLLFGLNCAMILDSKQSVNSKDLPSLGVLLLAASLPRSRHQIALAVEVHCSDLN